MPAKKPPRLKIEYVDPRSLKPWKGNPRVMSEEEHEHLQGSLKGFSGLAPGGIVDPIIVRRKDGLVIGGHQRIEDAIKLGLKEVPIVRINPSERQMKALNLALNKIHGEWNEELLAPLLLEMKDLPEIDYTGFDQSEISKLIHDVLPQTEEDEIPEPPVEPITKQGDIWQLGKHRILCGDSTKPEDVEKLTGGGVGFALPN